MRPTAALRGVMGLQAVADVDLIRHAYVLPEWQRHGIGGALLRHLQRQSTRRILVGTWAAAAWAIDFYQRHGFALVAPAGQGHVAADVLDNPGPADRNLGGAGQPAVP